MCITVINLGGEGEIPDVWNQQMRHVANDGWGSSPLDYTRAGKTFRELLAEGHLFLICPNDPLPFPDGCMRLVYTNSVPIDQNAFHGPGIRSSEIRRILAPGGQ